MSQWEHYLEEIYFDPSHPASFESPLRLYQIVKKEGKLEFSRFEKSKKRIDDLSKILSEMDETTPVFK